MSDNYGMFSDDNNRYNSDTKAWHKVSEWKYGFRLKKVPIEDAIDIYDFDSSEVDEEEIKHHSSHDHIYLSLLKTKLLDLHSAEEEKRKAGSKKKNHTFNIREITDLVDKEQRWPITWEIDQFCEEQNWKRKGLYIWYKGIKQKRAWKVDSLLRPLYYGLANIFLETFNAPSKVSPYESIKQFGELFRDYEMLSGDSGKKAFAKKQLEEHKEHLVELLQTKADYDKYGSELMRWVDRFTRWTVVTPK